ncbi:MAG: phospholipase D family protein [Lachnospiraceae bacterium]|nr:phospholipase D family protein [Lachnospiraceae bacterium]
MGKEEIGGKTESVKELRTGKGEKKRGKIRWIALFPAGVFLYLVIGAIAPFARLKEVANPSLYAISREDLAAAGKGDRAMLLETATEAWEERLRLLSQAKERIILSTFDIREDESARDILSVILKKADEGVRVKIFVDGFSGQAHMGRRDLFRLVAAHPNIEIKWYNPVNLLTPWTSQGRMHDKYLIVDDLAYILGGRNMYDYFIGDYESDSKSYDREVLVYNPGWARGSEGSSLEQVEAYFEDIWEMDVCRYYYDDESLAKREDIRAERERLEERYDELRERRPDLFEPQGPGAYDYEAVTCETDAIRLLSNPTTIYGKEPVVFYQLTELMKQAKDRVMIHTPYAVCSDYMYRTLQEVGQAVPDVRLLINSVENGDNFVASSDYLWNKEELVATGLDLYEYDGGLSYHAKSVVIDDDISIIGSFNFDMRSTYADTELMLVIQSRKLTEELAGNMERIQRDCRKVVSATEYETPEHIAVEPVPGWKMFLMRAFGLILQPFRYLA